MDKNFGLEKSKLCPREAEWLATLSAGKFEIFCSNRMSILYECMFICIKQGIVIFFQWSNIIFYEKKYSLEFFIPNNKDLNLRKLQSKFSKKKKKKKKKKNVKWKY